MTGQNILKPTEEEIHSLVEVAMGSKEADIVISGGDIVNVYTGELLKGWSVAITGRWIAYVGEDAMHTIGPNTEVIDAAGKVLIPGLIDGHIHALWIHSLEELIKYAIKCGTTTIISDTTDFSYTLGYDGVIQFMESASGQPVKVFATLPSIFATAQPDYADVMTPNMFGQLIQREEVLGLGESNWTPVTRGDKRVINLFTDISSHRKQLEGHSAGATGRTLAAFVAAGVSSCHESTTAKEAMEKLRLGMCVMVREGGGRKDLEAVSAIKNENIDFRRLALATDIVSAKNIIEQGYMNHVVQRAIELGFPPITAIRMATINVAEHFSIDNTVGGIAPGKFADILIIPDLEVIEPQCVISNGRVVCLNGERLVAPVPYRYPESSMATVRLPRKMEAADFRIMVSGGEKEITARTIDLTTDIANKQGFVTLPVVNDEVNLNDDLDIQKVAAIDRLYNRGKMFVALVRGFGMKEGAFATSASWNASNVVVVGVDEEDMAGAVNRIRELQGGAVVYSNGQILAELAMPVGGNVSNLAMEDIASRLEQIRCVLFNLGCELEDPHLALVTLTCMVIPAVRISAGGLINIKNGVLLGLFDQ